MSIFGRRAKRNACATPADVVHLRLVRLEERVLLDGVGLVYDINQGPASSEPTEFAEFNGHLYFSARGQDARGNDVGRELYRLAPDGTVSLAADINPGPGDSSPAGFTEFNGNLYFAARGRSPFGYDAGRELYRIDRQGVVSLVADINFGSADSSPAGFTEFDGRLYFAATDTDIFGGIVGRELYSVDRFQQVRLVENINTMNGGAASSNPRDFTPFDGKLYFAAATNRGEELYALDRTGDVRLVADIFPGFALGTNPHSSRPDDFFIYDGKLFFAATDASGRGLYELEPGANASPKRIDLGAGVSDPQGFTPFQDSVYFSALQGGERRLFELEGCTVRPVASSGSLAAPTEFAVFQDSLYFSAVGQNAAGQNVGRELFRLDAGGHVSLVADLNAGSAGSDPSGFQELGGKLYFSATTELGNELYRVDASDRVILVEDIRAGAGSSQPAQLTEFSGSLYFTAFEPTVGRELFQVHPSDSSLKIIGSTLVFRDDAGDRDNRVVLFSDGVSLWILDENGHTLETSIPGATGFTTNLIVIPLASLQGVTRFAIYGEGGDDTLTVDLSAHAGALLGRFSAVDFDGGGNATLVPGDRFQIVGDGVATAVYTPDATTTGKGVVEVRRGSLTTAFQFQNIEPLDVSGMAQVVLATPTTLGRDRLTVREGFDAATGKIPALVVSGTVGGIPIEAAHLFNNATIIIDTTRGLGGPDEVTIASAANAHGNVNLIVRTGDNGAAPDSVSILGATAFAGNLDIATSQIDVAAAVQAGGNVRLSANRDINFTAAGSVRALGPGEIFVEADANRFLIGAIQMANGSFLDAGTGTLTLLATDDITVGQLITANATAAAVLVESRAGRVRDGGDLGGADIVATAAGAQVTIRARDGVGAPGAAALDTDVSRLIVLTTNANQYLAEKDGLTALNLDAGNGDIFLSAGGAIIDGDDARDVRGTNVTLVASAGIGSPAAPLQTQIVRLEADAGGSLHLTETNNLQIGGVGPLAGVRAGGDIVLVAGNELTVSESVTSVSAGRIALTAGDDLLVNAPVTSQGGQIDLLAEDNIVLAGLVSADAVAIESKTGSIRDDQDAGAVDVAASTLVLIAHGDAGAANNALETQVVRLAATVGGGAFVAERDDLTVDRINGVAGLAAEGNIVLGAGGQLRVAEHVISQTGAIALTAGTDLRLEAPLTTSNGAATLLAGRNLLATTPAVLQTAGGDILLAADQGSIQFAADIRAGGGQTAFRLADDDGLFSGVLSGTGNLVKEGAGRLALTGGNAYAGVTLVRAGVLQVDGVLGADRTAGEVTVLAGAVLAGRGTMNVARVQAQAGGTIDPGGALAGVLSTRTGDLALNGGAILKLDLFGETAGSSYDQFSVAGAVILDGAVLDLRGGNFAPTPGAVFVLIDNDGFDPVSGRFVDRQTGRVLEEGALVTVGQVTAILSYKAGAGGNDVTLSVPTGTFVVRPPQPGDGVPNVLQLQRNGLNLEFLEGGDRFGNGGTVVEARPLAAISDVLVLGSLTEGDLLVIDYANDGVFAVPIAFRAGDVGEDGLNVIGGAFSSLTLTAQSPGQGVLDFAGLPSIAFQGVEPLFTTATLDALHVAFLGNASQHVLLSDDAEGMADFSRLSTGDGWADLTFRNPAALLAVAAGGGNDAFRVQTLDAAFRASLELDGQAGDDLAVFEADLNLGSNRSAGNLLVTAEAIRVAPHVTIDTTAGLLGDVSLRAGRRIEFGAGAQVVTASGAVELTAGGGSDAGIYLAGGELRSQSGAIRIHSVGSVELGRLTTAADATIESTQGAIRDGDHNAAVNVAAQTVSLTAALGIGDPTNPLETAAGVLSLRVTGNGSIDLVEQDAVTLAQAVAANGAIRVTSGGTMTAEQVQSLTDREENDIRLRASAGNLVVRRVVIGNGLAASQGDVVLQALGGDILVAAGAAAPQIVGDEALLVAAGAVGEVDRPLVASLREIAGAAGAGFYLHNLADLEIGAVEGQAGIVAGAAVGVKSAGALAISQAVAAGGAVRLEADRDLRLVGAGRIDTRSANAPIVLQAGGAIDLTAGTQVLAGHATIELLAIGDIALTGVVTTGRVAVTSNLGAIRDGGDTHLDVSAGDLVLSAGGNIGAPANPLETAIAQLAAETGGSLAIANVGDLQANRLLAAQNIALSATGALTLREAATSTQGGAVALTAGTNLTLQAPVTSPGGEVRLLAEGDILLGGLVTAANVTLESNAGAILDDFDAGALDVTATNLVLRAAGNLGVAENPLETAIAHLAAQGGGGLFLHEADDLTVGQVELRGDLSLVAGGAITVAESVASSTLGSLALTAGTTLTVQAAIAAPNGAAHLAAGGNLVLGGLVSAVNVTLASRSGSILDDGDGGALDIAATALAMSAAGQIGTAANALETSVSRVAAEAGGGIFFDNAGPLEIGAVGSLAGIRAGEAISVSARGALTVRESVTSTSSGAIALAALNDFWVAAPITSTNGIVALDAGGNVLLGGHVAGRAVMIVAAGAVLDDLDGGALDISAQALSLTAGGDIGAADNPLETAVGQLTAQAGGSLSVVEADDVTVDAVRAGQAISLTAGGAVTVREAIVSTGGGAIALTAGQGLVLQAAVTTLGGVARLIAADDILVGGLVTAAHVTLESAAGSILDDGDSGALDVAAAALVLLAAGDIGTPDNALELAVERLDAQAGHNLVVVDAGNLVVGRASAADRLSIAAVGDLLLAGLVSAQAVSLESFFGSILDDGDAGALDISAAVLVIGAAGDIGAADNPLEIAVERLEGQAGGGIFVHDADDLSLGPIRAGSRVAISAGGALTVVNEVRLASAGEIALAAAARLSVDAPVTAAGGVIRLTAGGDVVLAALVTANHVDIASLGSILDDPEAGAVDLAATTASLAAAGDIGAADNPLEIAVDRIAVVAGRGGVGGIFLSEVDDLEIGQVGALAGVVAPGDVILAAGGHLVLAASIAAAHATLTVGGSLVDAQSTNAPDIAALALTLTVGGSVGAANDPVETAIGRLTAEVGGGLFLVNAGDLTVGGVHAGGAASISANGVLLVEEAVQGGSIALAATGNLLLRAPLMGGGGGIALTSGGDLLATAAADIANVGGEVVLLADFGTIQFFGDIRNDGGNTVFRLAGDDGRLDGALSGAGGLVKDGAGQLTLLASNTYAGATSILAGVLRVEGAIGAAGPAGVVTLAGGAVLTGGGDVNAPIFSAQSASLIVSTGNLRLGDGSTAGFVFAGVLQIGAGHVVTLRDADLAELGVSTSLGAGSTLAAAGGVEVGSGDVLAGAGVVAGNVVVLGGGAVSPGDSIGIFGTGRGDLLLAPGTRLNLDLQGTVPGAQFDQLNIQGAVSVDGAILNLAIGNFSIAPNTQLVLIRNDGADPVRGAFVDAANRPLLEGSRIDINGASGVLSYVGGEGGNDVVITFAARQIIFIVPSDGSTTSSNSGRSSVTALLLFFVSEVSARAEAASSTNVIPVLVEAGADGAGAEFSETRSGTLETEVKEGLQLFLRTYDAALQEEGQRYALKIEDLNDLLQIFQRRRFPNGQYRIYVEDPATNRVSLVLEVNVYDGKVVPKNLRQEAGDAEFPAAGSPAAAVHEETPNQAAPPEAAERLPSPQSQAVPDPPDAAAPGSPAGAPSDGQANRSATPTGALAMAAVAVGGAARGRAWSDRVREAMEQGPPRSQASRLARRWRPPQPR